MMIMLTVIMLGPELAICVNNPSAILRTPTVFTAHIPFSTIEWHPCSHPGCLYRILQVLQVTPLKLNFHLQSRGPTLIHP